MIISSNRLRLTLISVALLGVIALMFGFSGTRFLKGSLLDDRVLTLGDINPKDGALSVREMRKLIVAEIAAITTNATNFQSAYDLNNSGAVDHADLVLLGQTLRAFLAAVCRNGIVEAGEQCDDGNASNNDFCLNTCKLSSCGDGFMQGAETCDDGNAVDTDSCSNTCVLARCGDGVTQTGEQCDDGNQINEDFCTGICKLATCGDGFKQGAEACDDGNTVDTDSCRNSCVLPVCGDGIVQGIEQCDDGNASQTDSCMNACTIPVSDTGIEQFCANNNVSGSLNGVSESASAYPSTITFGGEAYVGVGVIGAKTTGTIYRSVRQNGIARWIKETQFPAVSSSAYANIRFFSTPSHLVATLEPSGTGSMIFRREQNGTWTNISFAVPSALRIGSVVEKEGKLYLTALNTGIVYRYEGGRVWTQVATPIATLRDIASLNDTLYAISVSNLYRYDGVSWVNVPIQGLPFANATTFATVFQMVSFGESLFVSGVDGETQKSMVFKFNPIALFTPATKMQVGNPPTGMSQLGLQVAGNTLVASAYSSPTQFSYFRFVPALNQWSILSTIAYTSGRTINNALVTMQSAVSPTPMWYVTCSKPIICGDAVKDSGESCDDGNANDTDSCRNNCTFSSCGNGTVESGESCDDHNQTNNDGCNAFCGIESGFSCTGNPSVCIHTPVCGDGVIEGNEQCDGGSSCTSSCTVIPKCGDGIVNQASEECDDGDDSWKNSSVANYSEADSCTSSCKRRTPLPYAFCAQDAVYCLNDRTPLCPTSLPNVVCKFGSASCCDSRRCVQMANLCEGALPPNPPPYAYCSVGSTQHFCSNGSTPTCPADRPISLCYENTIDGNNITHDRPVCCSATVCDAQPSCGL